MPVPFGDLLEAFEFANAGGSIAEFNAYICRQTGKIYYQSDFGSGEVEPGDELPDDIDDREKYLPLPDKRDLDLGKSLVLDFVGEHLPGDYDEVRYFFRKRGGYQKFKALLARRHAIDRWHAFEDKATEQALRDWCAVHDIEIAD